MSKRIRTVDEIAADVAVKVAGTPAQETPQAALIPQAETQIETPAWHGDVRSMVYRWEIPGPHGYALVIDVADAESPDLARVAALSYEVPTDTDSETRPLSAVEVNWIRTTDARAVRETSALTLDHDTALQDNARLTAENGAFRRCRRLFAERGIDVFNPQAWLAKVDAERDMLIAEAEAHRDARHQTLAAELLALQGALVRAIAATGFAPPPAQAPSEPDYSKLTVFARGPAAVRDEFPRLAAANWALADPREPLTEPESQGLDLLMRSGGVIDDVIYTQPISELETLSLRAIAARIRAELKAA